MNGHVGFTGTQRGLSAEQRQRLKECLMMLQAHGYVALHHGDCVGADAAAHELATELGFRVVIHPPEDPKKRAWCTSGQVLPVKPYLARNRDIVKATALLVACPGEVVEQLRYGTWATVRCARAKKRQIIMVLP